MDVQDRVSTSNKCTSVPTHQTGLSAELAGVTIQGNCACVSDVCLGLPWQGFLWAEDIPPTIFIKTRVLFTTKAVFRITLRTAGLRNSQDIRNWKTSDKQVVQWKSTADAAESQVATTIGLQVRISDVVYTVRSLNDQPTA